MDVFSWKCYQDVTAIGLKLLTKNEIQLSTMLIRIYCEFNPFKERINFHKSQNHSTASFLPRHPLPHVSKTCLNLQEISDSEDDYCTGCRNVSHCQQQQSYSGLCSPGRSNSTYFRIIIVQRIFKDPTERPLEHGHLESNHNCFWKQKFLKFSTNRPVTLMNFSTVSWEVR